MSTDKKVKELKAWTAQMRRILKLQQGKGNEEELRSLRDWCLGRYGSRYGDVIDEAFAGLALA